jgi:hypothetical protein
LQGTAKSNAASLYLRAAGIANCGDCYARQKLEASSGCVGRTLLSDKRSVSLHRLIVHWSQTSRNAFQYKDKVKGVGQGCPTHTATLCPSGLLWQECTNTGALPHYQKAGRPVFVTFCKGNRQPFPSQARDLVLRSCLHDDGKRYQLHAAVVMPEHVHLHLDTARG